MYEDRIFQFIRHRNLSDNYFNLEELKVSLGKAKFDILKFNAVNVFPNNKSSFWLLKLSIKENRPQHVALVKKISKYWIFSWNWFSNNSSLLLIVFCIHIVISFLLSVTLNLADITMVDIWATWLVQNYQSINQLYSHSVNQSIFFIKSLVLARKNGENMPL